VTGQASGTVDWEVDKTLQGRSRKDSLTLGEHSLYWLPCALGIEEADEEHEIRAELHD
jgi:hypothetical protein